jgi:Abnormal spindle-like microcephaly-assoc'd, ASPM-SPD-2-Hydin
MTLGSLDQRSRPPDNRSMERSNSSRLPLFSGLLALVSLLIALTGCSGVSAGANSQVVSNPDPNPNQTGTLAVSPSTLKFGNVAVGSNASLTGTLSATTANVTVSSAAWTGSGYTVSGITFPVTVTVGQNTNYTVTFTPPSSGSSPGGITFTSDATDASLQQSFSGSGTSSTPPSQSTVSLNWDPSTSTVIGYNLYRGTTSGGPYATKLNSSLISTTAFTDSTVESGTTYYYVSTAVNSSNVESAYSNEASAAVP